MVLLYPAAAISRCICSNTGLVLVVPSSLFWTSVEDQSERKHAVSSSDQWYFELVSIVKTFPVFSWGCERWLVNVLLFFFFFQNGAVSSCRLNDVTPPFEPIRCPLPQIQPGRGVESAGIHCSREDEAAERMRGSHNGTKSCRTGLSRPWKRAVIRLTDLAQCTVFIADRVTSIRQLRSDKCKGNVRFTAMYFL